MVSSNFKKEILIIGKTGAGKSSFINYMLGIKECETGTGKPVTPKGVYRIEHNEEYHLYDTWGLEAEKFSEWKKMLDDVLENRKEENIALPIKGFFDSIFYCISAKSGRIEEKEQAVIKFLIEKKEPPVIILTKSDIAHEENREELKKELKLMHSDIKILEVGSVAKKTLSGKVGEIFGKEEVEKLIYADSLDKLVNFMPGFIVKKLQEEVKDDLREIERELQNEIIFSNLDLKAYNEKLRKIIQYEVPERLSVLSEEILERYKVEGVISLSEPLYSICQNMKYKLTVSFFKKNPSKIEMTNHFHNIFEKLNEQLKDLETEAELEIRNNIIRNGSSILFCSKCELKLKVSIRRKNLCPKCGNKEDVPKYYSRSLEVKREPHKTYRIDEDLEFFSKCTDEELENLFDCLVYDKDGKTRISESLSNSEEYKKWGDNYSQYWDTIAGEFQSFGGNSIANIFRAGKGVTYQEILKDVASDMKVKYSKKDSVEEIENKLILKTFNDSWDKMSTAEKEKLVEEVGISGVQSGVQGALGIVPLTKKLGIYNLTVITVNAVSRALLGKGLVLAGKATLTKSVSMFAGPIGWAVTGAWTIFEVASPAKRVIIPAVFNIILMRKNVERRLSL